MAKQQPIEIFMPPNVLKVKVGGFGGIDAAAIKRAEAALDQLKANFGDWLAQEIDLLAAARTAYRDEPGDAKRAELFRAAHDLKGLGSTYEYPIITRIAGSLCRMIEQVPVTMALPFGLVDAHVDAIRVAVRDSIRTVDHPAAAPLVGELERQVDERIAELAQTPQP